MVAKSLMLPGVLRGDARVFFERNVKAKYWKSHVPAKLGSQYRFLFRLQMWFVSHTVIVDEMPVMICANAKCASQ